MREGQYSILFVAFFVFAPRVCLFLSLCISFPPFAGGWAGMRAEFVAVDLLSFT